MTTSCAAVGTQDPGTHPTTKIKMRLLAVAVGEKGLPLSNVNVGADPKINELRPIIQRVGFHLREILEKVSNQYDLKIDYAEGRPEHWDNPTRSADDDLAANIRRLLASGPDVILSVSSAATKVAQAVLKSGIDLAAKPLIFTVVSEPVMEGIVDFETGQRTNRTTGISTSLAQTVVECATRFYLMFSDQAPKFKVHFVYRDERYCHVAFNAHKRLDENAPQHIKKIIEGHKLNYDENPNEGIKRSLDKYSNGTTIQHGLLLSPDDRMFASRRGIISYALDKRIPTFVQHPDLDESDPNGPLAGFGLSSDTIGRLAADYAFRVLQNPDNANTLPVLRPTDFRFKVSPAVSKRLNLDPGLLSSWQERTQRGV